MQCADESWLFEQANGRPFRFGRATEHQWSDLRALLRENHNLPALHVSPLLQVAENDLMDCEAEVTRQKAYLLRVENERDRLRQHRDAYRSMLSPIRHIPIEILAHIFAFFCEENLLAMDSSRGDTISIPGSVLVQVCSQWRQVALATGELWTTIRVDGQQLDDGDLESRAPILQFPLKRSNNYPLSLIINVGEYTVRLYRPMSELVELLVKHSFRWRSVELHATSLRSTGCLSSIKGRVPLLEHIQADLLTDSEFPSLDVFQEAPMLTSAMVYEDMSPGSIILPWNQLRTIEMFFPRKPMEILACCPQILELIISAPSRDATEEIDLTLGLQALTVTDIHGNHPVDILNHFTLPDLKTLTLGGLVPSPIFLSLIARSRCALTEVTCLIEFLPLDMAEWVTMLRSVPSLRTITFQHQHDIVQQMDSSLFFLALYTPPIILPNLRNLTFTARACPVELVIQAITLRRKAHDGFVCLESVRLCFTEEFMEQNELDALELLTVDGMKMSVEDSTGIVLDT
ncbi:hypothetical protein C8J56DRAFT_829434 [Mycena floridula]|nr:hypothetical protein C8J56DRAFT_829434 [Mycena floridula]